MRKKEKAAYACHCLSRLLRCPDRTGAQSFRSDIYAITTLEGNFWWKNHPWRGLAKPGPFILKGPGFAINHKG